MSPVIDRRRFLVKRPPSKSGKLIIAPDEIACTTYWLDGSDPTSLFTDTARTTPVSSDGDYIAGINSQISPASYYCNQGTQAYQPQYRTNVQNGLSAIDLRTNANKIGMYDNTIKNIHEIWAAFKFGAGVTTLHKYGYFSGGSFGNSCFSYSNKLGTYHNGVTWIAWGPAKDYEWHILRWVMTTSEQKGYIDGVYQPGSYWSGTFTIGATRELLGRTNNSSLIGFYGDYFYLSDGYASDQEAEGLNNYLSEKWDIPLAS